MGTSATFLLLEMPSRSSNFKIKIISKLFLESSVFSFRPDNYPFSKEAKWAVTHHVCLNDSRCVCVCENTDSIHPVLWEHVHACVTVSTSYPPISSSLLRTDYEHWSWLKWLWILQSLLTSGNVPVLAGLKRTGASFQKTPALLSLSLPHSFPSLIFSSPLTAATLPLDWTRGLLKYLPWSSLHFKVDLSPLSQTRGGGPTSRWPSPWLVGTSKTMTWGVWKLNTQKSRWLMLSCVHFKCLPNIWVKYILIIRNWG